jgi:hypothetical protein
MILYRRSKMLARKQPKEKDAVDRMLDQIDFHGMAKDEILGALYVKKDDTEGTPLVDGVTNCV